MSTPSDEDIRLDIINLQSELALRRARRMVEWLRTVYENEAYISGQSATASEQNTEELIDANGSRE